MPQLNDVYRVVCPKCSERMNLVPGLSAIPTHIGSGVRSPTDKSPRFSLSEALTVEVYFCPNCRFIELYAA